MIIFKSQRRFKNRFISIICMFLHFFFSILTCLFNINFFLFQVSLVRTQLRRATERYGSLNSRKFSNPLSQPLEKECGGTNHEISAKLDSIPEHCGTSRHGSDHATKILERVKSSSTSSGVCLSNELGSKGQENVATKGTEETKKPDALVIPDDFLCPISLELLRDPVIVATGQV